MVPQIAENRLNYFCRTIKPKCLGNCLRTCCGQLPSHLQRVHVSNFQIPKFQNFKVLMFQIWSKSGNCQTLPSINSPLQTNNKPIINLNMLKNAKDCWASFELLLNVDRQSRINPKPDLSRDPNECQNVDSRH